MMVAITMVSTMVITIIGAFHMNSLGLNIDSP